MEGSILGFSFEPITNSLPATVLLLALLLLQQDSLSFVRAPILEPLLALSATASCSRLLQCSQ